MYLLLKTLHVFAVVLFLGNIITGIFWKTHAEHTRDPRLIAHAFEGITASDRWFTIPGVVVIIATGVLAAINARLPLLGTGWILWSLVLFAVSGVAFMVWVAPLQRRIAAFARAAGATQLDWARYREMAQRWELWGLVAVITPLAALVLMVLKPDLPAL
ncbi:MAG: DUF2269 family protein [Gammaproteobacteria bacterium]